MKTNINKTFFKLIISVFIINIICFSLNINNYSFAVEASLPNVQSEAAILIDQDSGNVLYAKNAYTEMYPASTTKILTAIVVLENVKDLNEKAKVSYWALHSVPYTYSSANLWKDEEFTIDQLLHLLLIPSANDAAYVLAEYVANAGNNYTTGESNKEKEAFQNSIANFSQMMNNKAKEIGCKSTNFVNPNGIHNENHITTAYDLALMGRYAMKFDKIKSICQTKQYSIPNTNIYDGEPRIFNNTNPLFKEGTKYYYEYATGLKTGYTDAARNCIIETATKGDMNLIVVVLHGLVTEEGIKQREEDLITLFEYGFNNYKNKVISPKNTVAKTISVKNGSMDTRSLELVLEDDVKAIVPNDFNFEEYTPNIILNDNIVAPVTKGDVLGTISYGINGQSFTGNLIASHDVKQYDYTIINLIVIFAMLLIVYKLFFGKKKKKKNYRKKKSKGSINSRNTYKIDKYNF